MTTVLVLAIIAVSTTTAAALSCSGDICVNPSGWWRDGGSLNASATPIQAAVDNANAGETICVAAGSYTENVHVNKRLTLRGEGADVVTVTAASSDHVFEVTADYVNISGFTATGATTYKTGIYLYGADHCNISENDCSNNYCGIQLWPSSNNTLKSNTASNNNVGIDLTLSSNNTLASNNASNNIHGIILCFSSNNTFTSNTANSNNNSGIYLSYSSNYSTLTNNIANSNNDSGIRLSYSSNNNTLANNIASNNGDGDPYHKNCGICLSDSSDNTLTSNTANSNAGYGIRLLFSSDHNTLESNIASNNDDGIYLLFSSNNTLASNTANSNNNYGIVLYSSSNNTLANNNASNNYRGVYLHSSCDNDITCNLVQNNTCCGIYLTSGSIGNNIAWNNIVANGELQTDGSYHYQFKNSQSDGVDAINNFWGSGMNNDTIDASIYEMGSAVEFYPFETEPVPCAPAPISEESPAFTTADAVIALRIAVGSCPLDLYWDVSGDGQVTSLDALMIVMDTGTG